MMKKILVPIDFSEHSEYALQTAASIAREQNAEIIALHMLGLSEAVLTKDDAQEVAEAMYYMKLAKKRFETFLNKPYLKDVKITETVQNYKIFSEVNDVAKENNVDLIIMGSHGASGLSEIFVGSNTEKVVRSAVVPVLVIKKQRDTFRIKDAVFACDFKIASIPAYHKAMKFFEAFDTNMHLIYINLPGESFRSTEQIEERIKEFLQKADGNTDRLETITVLNDYSIESGIFNYSNKIEADIIAVPTHGRRGLSHFFNGSISEDIANHANKPVITFRM